MTPYTTHAPAWPRLAAPDRHPTRRSVPLALSRLDVRRRASTIHGHPGTWAAQGII